MSKQPVILLVNDDGVLSPLLKPVAERLKRLGELRLVVPHDEQSWKGKSMTRFGHIKAHRQEGFGCPAFSVEGTPADCVNLAVHNLFGSPPDWVVSGVNIGYNYGLNLAMNSGTLGAALEGALSGLPSVAYSLETPHEVYHEWVTHFRMSGPKAEEMIAQSALWVERMTRTLMAQGLPEPWMTLNVNFPHSLGPQSQVAWTPLRENRYGKLFEEEPEGFCHRYKGEVWAAEKGELDDVRAVRQGLISVTALSMARMAFVPKNAIQF